MRDDVRFSVAMCTYNGEKYLGEQLESIARQELLPEELIICDDCSIDATLSIAERFAAESPFAVRIVRNQKNLGYSGNFARAIELCTGELIALCDQDDVWYPQKLKRLKELFLNDPSVAGVFSNGDLIDSSSRRLGKDLWGSFQFDAFDQEHFRSGQAVEVLVRRNVVTGMTLAIRSSSKKELLTMPSNWNHDAWLALMLAAHARLIACPEHLVAYRIHANQQIGVPISLGEKCRYILSYGVSAYIQLSRDRNQKVYRENALQFDALQVSLEKQGNPGDDHLLIEACAKAEHAHRGDALLSLSRWRRLPTVLGHLRSYKKYSPTGLDAALRDLIL
ncbi:glycosyltransferase family 2 protein [Tunturibacter empetritectus]|uniref:Glycosyltransferase involved in cell wall biosynthesis n=1 Tax=Tunturiibacter lichenicola TaxID=2051959 RepID=A0A7W8N366_9BACT|nr:glycosyltransferase family 2 protein [Edaphobacter lichenicola]MBB5342196.1 glycosyltransferase involved in cell wall biosynthesis [Edaphobacter lichenicola]